VYDFPSLLYFIEGRIPRKLFWSMCVLVPVEISNAKQSCIMKETHTCTQVHSSHAPGESEDKKVTKRRLSRPGSAMAIAASTASWLTCIDQKGQFVRVFRKWVISNEHIAIRLTCIIKGHGREVFRKWVISNNHTAIWLTCIIKGA